MTSHFPQPLRTLKLLLCVTMLGMLGACGQTLSSAATSPTGLASAWQDAPLLAPDNEWGAFDHHQAIDAQGHTMAVWEQFDGKRYNIWANRRLAGSGWGVAQLIETDNAGDAFNPRVAMDSQGNAVAVWQQSDGMHTHIGANRYMVGTGWSTAVWIDAPDASDAHTPQVSFDVQGNAVAVWQQQQGTRSSIHGNRMVAGAGWGSATPIENGSGHASAPQIASDASGQVLVVWHLQGSHHTTVVASRYLAGAGWGTATQIAPAKVNAYNPKIGLDTHGEVLAQWQQPQGAHNYNGTSRYAAGVGWGTPTTVADDYNSQH
jgi:hypothetical protein